MGLTDWEIVTHYMDSVGTTLKTFTFNKPQDYVRVTNKGNANISYTIGTQTGTLTPGQTKEVSEVISSFNLTATSGTQSIEVFAKEDGTEKVESASTSRWAGKKYLACGDSITWYDGNVLNGTNGVVCVGYPQEMVKRLGVNYTNIGVSGMSMVKTAQFFNSFQNLMTTTNFTSYDLITLAFGINDFLLYGGANIGTIGNKTDTTFDDTTFYGAYRKAVEYILNANKDVKLVLLTPLQTLEIEPNTTGNKVVDYVNAVKAIGEMYGLPVCDLHRNVGFNKISLNSFTIDGTHPNNAGHYEMGSYVSEFIAKL